MDQPGVAQHALDRIPHLRDEALALSPLGGDEPCETLVSVRLEVLEREVLQLPPQLRHSKAVGERRVEVHRLLRNAPTLLLAEIIQRPHVVQAIGELDQDDARVLRDGQEELAIVLDLALLRRPERDVPDLGYAVHDRGDLAAELALDLLDADARVLDDIVDQAARHGHGIEVQLSQDLRDLDAMGDVGVPGRALLSRVRTVGEPVRAREKIDVEPLHRGCVIDCPSRDDRAQRRCRHYSSPASAKLTYRPRPTIT
jgi:hypothetical protein